MRTPTFLALAIVASSFATVPARAGDPPPDRGDRLPAETLHLSNGLHVLLAPDPRARVVSVVVSYAVGVADDPDGRRGLADLAEHFAVRRTKHIECPARVLELAGAWFTGRTRAEATTFSESLPAEHLETALWLESDRMGHTAETVTREALAQEREAVRTEDHAALVDTTLAAVGEVTYRELFPDWHPYSTVPDGAADLDDIEPQDVRAFLDTWYTPRNATLAIAGRFDRDKAVAMVKRYFESLPSPPPPVRPALPQWETPSTLLAVTAATSNDRVVLAWRTPAFGHGEDAALDMAATILAGTGNERFEHSIIATHLATSVSAVQRSERQQSIFYVVADVAPGVHPGVVIDRIQATMKGLERDLEPHEVARAARLWHDEALSRIETPWGRASRLVSLARLGLVPGPSFDWGLGRYDGVQGSDVSGAVVSWLSPEHRVATAVFGNQSAPRRGKLVGREEVGP